MHRKLIFALALCAACKSDTAKAKDVVADPSKPPTQALTDAAKLLWTDSSEARHTIGCECDGPCRVFVIVDRSDKGTVETHGSDVTITFPKIVDARHDELVHEMLGIGAPLKLVEVNVAYRYKTQVNGDRVTVVAPTRTVVKDATSQSFHDWNLDDMARLEPYDGVIGADGSVVLHDRH